MLYRDMYVGIGHPFFPKGFFIHPRFHGYWLEKINIKESSAASIQLDILVLQKHGPSLQTIITHSGLGAKGIPYKNVDIVFVIFYLTKIGIHYGLSILRILKWLQTQGFVHRNIEPVLLSLNWLFLNVLFFFLHAGKFSCIGSQKHRRRGMHSLRFCHLYKNLIFLSLVGTYSYVFFSPASLSTGI